MLENITESFELIASPSQLSTCIPEKSCPWYKRQFEGLATQPHSALIGSVWSYKSVCKGCQDRPTYGACVVRGGLLWRRSTQWQYISGCAGVGLVWGCWAEEGLVQTGETGQGCSRLTWRGNEDWRQTIQASFYAWWGDPCLLSQSLLTGWERSSKERLLFTSMLTTSSQLPCQSDQCR